MAIRNTNHIYRKFLKKSERFPALSTKIVGTIWFFFGIFFWTVCWLGWNMLTPAEWSERNLVFHSA